MSLQNLGDIVAGRYEVVSALGAGGLGEVYLCQDAHSGTSVALKRLKSTQDIPPAILEQTQREARILSELKHRNIIRIYDFGMDSKGFYFALEYVEGPSLSDVLRGSILDQSTFVKFAGQCLEGLGAAHRKGLLHLDIKPANIMLHHFPGDEFTVKILDFGVAKLIEEVRHTGQDEETFGSIYYIAPEQLTQKPLDTRTDIYSLGHVFYQSLCGAIAFPEVKDMMALLQAHLYEAPVPLQQYHPALDTELCEWVYWLMGKSPDDRPESAQAALIELTKINLRLQKEQRPEEFFIPEPEPPPVSPEVPAVAKGGLLGRLFRRTAD